MRRSSPNKRFQRTGLALRFAARLKPTVSENRGTRGIAFNEVKREPVSGQVLQCHILSLTLQWN